MSRWVRAHFLILVSLLLVAVGASANECVAPGDPFAPPGIMPGGRHAGECLNTSVRRSYRILTAEEASRVLPASALVNAADYVYLANIGHDRRFWIGRFAKADAIESMSLLIERFPPTWLAAHSMLRLDFKPGREPTLYPQVGAGEPVKPGSFILSVEGVPLKDGPSFSPVSALQEYFAISKRMISLEQKVQQVIFKEKNTVRQYRMRLSETERHGLWDLLLRRLHDPDMRQMYSLFGHNCMNALFEVVDEFLGRERFLNNRIATSIPNVARSVLRHRDLMDESIALGTLNDEVQSARKSRYCPGLFKPDAETRVSLREASL